MPRTGIPPLAERGRFDGILSAADGQGFSTNTTSARSQKNFSSRSCHQQALHLSGARWVESVISLRKANRTQARKNLGGSPPRS